MTTGEFIAAVEAEAAKLPFVTQVVVADRTDYAIKLVLTIRPQLFVQLYANMDSGTHGYTLVYRGQRLYGRDCDAQGWHRHPVGDPLAHESSEEGKREVEIAQFLHEVQDILEEEKLL